MPLLPTTLIAEILKFSDPSSSNFVGFPATVQQTAEYWAQAFSVFLSEVIVPPGYLLAALPIGRPLMIAAMVALAIPNPASGVLYYPPGSGITALGNGLAALVAPVIAIALPAIVVPPPALFVPPPLPPVTNPTIPATAIATAAFLWAKTGTYTPTVPIPPIPWA